MTAPADLELPDFRTLLLGMKPSRSYHFRIVAETRDATVTSDDYVLETGEPTDLVDPIAVEAVDGTTSERGFIVTSYWQGPSGTVPFIVDADGEIVWWYESSSTGIARARMSVDGRNMWMVVANNEGGPVERVTMDTLDGEIYGDTVASHDITPVAGDLMAYLDYGEDDCDSIVEIDPSGATIEVFDTESVIMGGGLDRACHGNALRYSAAEDVYTLSDLNTDVFVINREGQLEWRLSQLVAGGNSTWGGAQHGHHLLDDSMLIFANRLGSNATSVALELSLDGDELLRYDSGHVSTNLGDVQRLPGGNTLVTYSNDSIIHEIDPEGNLVLEIDAGGYALGYASWRASLYGPPADITN
jgi:hypothetical protein